jgi:hypothetical protein
MIAGHRISDNSVFIIVGGVPSVVTQDNASFKALCAAIKRGADEAEIELLLNASKGIPVYTAGIPGLAWSADGSTATYQGDEIPASLVARMRNCLLAGTPVSYLEKFLQRLWANPSRSARQELFSFLENKNLPITPDGFFIGYKSVRPDWTDWHSGKFTNHIGTTLSMARRDVDDDRRNECSYGFHVGALEYASGFGGSDKILLYVKVDPADVVAVPADYNCQKLRTCKYEVMARYTGPLPESSVEDPGNYEPEFDDEDDGEEVIVTRIEEVREALQERNEIRDEIAEAEQKLAEAKARLSEVQEVIDDGLEEIGSLT